VSGLAAQAEWLASGAAYGGPAQKRAACYFTNISPNTSLVLQTGPTITNNNGVGQTLVIDECKDILNLVIPAEKTCGIAADIANNAVYSCQTRVADGDAINLRATLEFRDTSENVLRSIELR